MSPQNIPRLSCLDERTGVVLWSARLPEFTGHLAAARDAVLVAGWQGYTPLTAFDLQTGSLLWRSSERVEIAIPVVVESGVLVGEPHGCEIRVIDLRDGRIKARWSLLEPLASGDTQPVLTPLDSDRVLARCGSRTVVEASLSTGTAHAFFRSDDVDLVPRAVSRTGAILWVFKARRTVTVLDAHDGTPLRRFAAAGVDHPVHADSRFVIADFTGRLALVVPDPQVPQYSTHYRRIAQRIRVRRACGPGTVLVVTKVTAWSHMRRRCAASINATTRSASPAAPSGSSAGRCTCATGPTSSSMTSSLARTNASASNADRALPSANGWKKHTSR
jgi:outer membrane protein assembly factor BamB